MEIQIKEVTCVLLPIIKIQPYSSLVKCKWCERKRNSKESQSKCAMKSKEILLLRLKEVDIGNSLYSIVQYFL